MEKAVHDINILYVEGDEYLKEEDKVSIGLINGGTEIQYLEISMKNEPTKLFDYSKSPIKLKKHNSKKKFKKWIIDDVTNPIKVIYSYNDELYIFIWRDLNAPKGFRATMLSFLAFILGILDPYGPRSGSGGGLKN